MEARSDHGKSVAIVAYITLIGWIIALIRNNSDKSALGSYHLRQSLGIMCLFVVVNVIFGFIDIPFISWIVWAGIFVLWVLGLLSAINGELRPIPLFGRNFQEWFSGI